jgi:hypothetical protein
VVEAAAASVGRRRADAERLADILVVAEGERVVCDEQEAVRLERIVERLRALLARLHEKRELRVVEPREDFRPMLARVLAAAPGEIVGRHRGDGVGVERQQA